MKNKYEAVISGMAGRFPESSSLEEFQNNLMQKRNLVTTDERRWKPQSPLEHIPNCLGKVAERDDFDMTYFGLHRRLCLVTDPHQRQGLEMAFGAMVDAGYNPNELYGTNTGVIAATVTSETEYECLLDLANIGISILGHSRNKTANRMSYVFNLTGPSYSIDCSWNGALEGISSAVDMIERGAVKAVIVVCASLMYSAEVSFHYHQLGRLNTDGKTKSFSEDADGYSRSEGCVAFFLQRKEDARRIYGTPITFPTKLMGSKTCALKDIASNSFICALEKFYARANVDKNAIGFVEADGMASKVVDAIELNGIGDVLLKNRKEPLLIGCVKSNAGHSEAASSGVAIAKALLIANTGTIPPNLHYSEPNRHIPYLKNGQMKVVTEPTPLPGDIVAVNSFGQTGCIGHLLIKCHEKGKKRIPKVNELPPDGLPRLLLLSGRNGEGLLEVLKKVELKPIDEDYVALVNQVFKNGIKKHSHRGFTVLNNKNRVIRDTKDFFTGGQEVLPIWFVFTGMGSQWTGMGVNLMRIPIFAKSINHCHEILKPKGVDLLKIVTGSDPKIFDNILHSFVGIAAMQIGLVDLLNELGIKPDGIVGHSVGELGCAYADGCFTAEQMILAAYARGRASVEADLIPGMMAAVGLGYNTIKDEVPEGIEVACHNSSTSCTLSGPTHIMEEYINELKSRNIFAKLVNVANIAYHSKYIRPAAPALLKYLKEVVPEPKARSSKWISSSVPEKDWNNESAKYCSAEYHTNNLLGSVLFEEASKHIPTNAVIIEIAPHGLLQAILKKSFPNSVHVPLTNRSDEDGVMFLLGALGKLYLQGVNMNVEKLYPPVEFPVPRGTPSIDDLIVWDHSEKWRINMEYTIENYTQEDHGALLKCKKIILNPLLENFKYIVDHTIYGLPIIPLSYYLVHTLKDFLSLYQNEQSQVKYIIMRNINLAKHQEIMNETEVEVSLGAGTGSWEFVTQNHQIASGEIDLLLTVPKMMGRRVIGAEVNEEEIYKYFSHMSHDLGPAFRLCKSVRMSLTEISALITWNGNFTTFLDAVLKLPALMNMGDNKLYLVSKIKHIILDNSKFNIQNKRDILVYYNSETNVIECDGLIVLYPESRMPEVINHPDKAIICGALQYVPYGTHELNNEKEVIDLSLSIFFDNVHENIGSEAKITIIEVRDHIDVHSNMVEALKWRDNKIYFKPAATDNSLDGYEADSNAEYSFIVSGSDTIKYSAKVLQNCRSGFLLYVGELPTLPANMSVIFSQNIGHVKYTLCRLKKVLNESPKHISIESSNWKEQVLERLNKNENENIFLVGTFTTLPTTYSITKQFSKLPNSHLLRFIFIDSDDNQFQLHDFKEQLEKDLKINILRNGTWGLCLLKEKECSLEYKTALSTVYAFSDLRMKDGLAPKALGLSFTHCPSIHSKIEVVDYSGSFCNKDVCGIGRCLESSREIIPDPIYSWDKPQDISHEEAASVLLNYAMAYYIVSEDFGVEPFDVDRLLVHRGILPLSQAVINVALASSSEVFTTYKYEEEKQLIMQTFPRLPESHIISCEDYFDDQVLYLTKESGVRCVINTMTEKKYLTRSMNCLRFDGIFFQVGEEVMENGDTFGMRIFLKAVAISGMCPDTILGLPESKKKIIQSFIEDGFHDGTVKPPASIILSQRETNISSLSLLSQSWALDKKVIVSLDTESPEVQNTLYICDRDKSYIIIGNEQCFWLDMVEWLAKRGAERVYVFTNDSTLTVVSNEKVQSLLLKYPKLKCALPPESILNDSNSAGYFLEEINRNNILDSIFVVGEVEKTVTDVILTIFKNEKVVLLNKNANIICEERISSSLPTLAITLPHHLLSSYKILPRLDQLLTEDIQTIFISEETVNNKIDIDMERMEYFSHLPSSVNELLTLNKGSDVAVWKERRSLSSRMGSCPELPPVFVIPSLKPNLMDYQIKSLFYPVFIATMPTSMQDFEQMAYQLYQDIKRFNTSVFTILCSDWSWPVGIYLGKLLENDNMDLCLIFFESSITWESPAAYQQVLHVVERDISQNIYNNKYNTEQRPGVQKALHKLKYLLSLFATKLPSRTSKIRGICHYIRKNQATTDERFAKLQEYCERPINIYTANKPTYLEMMKDEDTIFHINTCVLVVHKDAARQVKRDYVPNSIFENTRLSYLTFIQNLHLNKRSNHTAKEAVVLL